MDYLEQRTAPMYRTVFLRSSTLLFLLCSVIIACRHEKKSSLPYYNTADFTPLFLEESAADSLITHRLAPFAFTNQHGKTIVDDNVDGKIHVADFFFSYCISICPVMTKNMQLVSDAFAKDTSVVLLSYSVTPWIDSVAQLKHFAASHHITNPNWHLLTGNTAQIYDLARTSYFAEEQLGFTKDSTDFLHTEHFILMDRKKRIRGIYNGTLELDMQQLIADIRQLQLD